MVFGDRLKNLRKGRNWTQSDLGKKLNVTKASISGYENDTRSPDKETLVKIANIFNVSTDYLLGNENIKKLNNEIQTVDKIPEEFTIPILGRIAASTPSGLVSDYEGSIAIQPSVIKRYGNKDIFALKVLGDSMNRIIPEGSIAVIHRSCDWDDGDICAVTINGDDATLKQVFHTENGIKFTPLSYSKFHAPWEYVKDEDEVDVLIHGVFLYGIILTDKM